MLLWIARDLNNELYLYLLEQVRRDVKFIINPDAESFVGHFMDIEPSLFPEVTWDNSPRKVKIELV